MAGKITITNCTDGVVSNNICSKIDVVNSDITLENNVELGLPLSSCCGAEMPDWPDCDLRPACHEHTGVEEE